MIKKLSDNDINKIAAGEVVKKPFNGYFFTNYDLVSYILFLSHKRISGK